MFVKPKTFAVVLDPVTRRPIPESGAEVPEDTYWLRRLRGGDVMVVEKAKTAIADPAKPVVLPNLNPD